MCVQSPTFFFWDLILRFQAIIFVFVRAHRERNFDLYVSTLEKLAPFLFGLDATNYSRWLPFHVRDMKSLLSTVLAQFKKENFTVTKIHAFRHDYMHEKQVSQMLSNYSNFVTLLDYDDDCFKLKFERLFPAEGFPRTLGGINNDTWTNIETQIHSIFEVFSTKQIQSSHEYLMGLNNIYIGSRGNVTMFDFHEYRYQNDTRMGGKPSGFQYNHTLETEHKHRLLAILREKRKTSKHQPKPKP